MSGEDQSVRDGTARTEPYRIVLRPVATPLPVGMLALLVNTSAVAGLQLGWIGPDQSVSVGRIVVVLALGLQLPGAAIGFWARDPAAGTGMAVLGGTWLAIGVTLALTPGSSTSAGLGLALLAAAVALVVPVTASLAKPVASVVMGLSALRFAATGVVQLGAPAPWSSVAGVLGLVLAVAALYAALAFELEDVHHRGVLPLLRRGAAREAVSGGPMDQVRGVEHEPGVRRQL